MRSLTLLFLLLSSHLYAQHFSGTITYKIYVEPKKDSVDIAAIANSQIGTLVDYTITDGYYKSTYQRDNQFTYSYTYHDDTKLMYDDAAGRSYITYRDSRKPGSTSIITTIIRDTTIMHLGYRCFLVKKISDQFKSTALYTDEIKVNHETFKGHAVGNWYNQLKELDGCLPLKTISEYPEYIQVQEAVNIENRNVDKTTFDLPSDKPIAASYSALDQPVTMVNPTQKQIECFTKKLSKAQVLKPKGQNEPYTSYLRFILKSNNEITNIEPFERDEYGLYKVAIEILDKCQLEFNPGLINGKAVDSEVYFPVKF